MAKAETWGDVQWQQEEAARLLSRSALEELGQWFQPAGAAGRTTAVDGKINDNYCIWYLIYF